MSAKLRRANLPAAVDFPALRCGLHGHGAFAVRRKHDGAMEPRAQRKTARTSPSAEAPIARLTSSLYIIMSVVEAEWGSRPGARRRAKSGARHAPTASCKKERKSCNNIRGRSMYLCTIKTNGAPLRAPTHLHPQTHNEALFSSPPLSSLRRRRVAVARPSGPNRRSR